VRLLPDTHAFLWLLADDERLSPRAAELLSDPGHEVLLSAAVVWEVAIKRALGKLDAPDGFAQTLLGAGAMSLAVTVEHAQAVGELPWHHRDPFDRMLVAQAGVERATLVSSADVLRTYGFPVDW
jgi:PIN domain nuclease of toxin-antitoxin system